MKGKPVITRIELHRFEHEHKDVGRDLSFALGPFYEPGSITHRRALAIRIHTDQGPVGEYVSIAPGTFEQICMFADLLIGKNALEREYFYNEAKAILRKNDKMGIGPIDIALWDLAGKYHDAPIYELLGGHRKKLPAYASTYHGDRTPPGWTARRRSPISPSSAWRWATRASRYTPGLLCPSSRRRPQSTRWESASEGRWT